MLPLVAPPTPMVSPLNVADPVAGIEAVGVRAPNANVPARPVVAVSPDAQNPYAAELRDCGPIDWVISEKSLLGDPYANRKIVAR